METLEICPQHTVDSCVIWMHGLGADGHDFAPVVAMLGLPNTRFILPHAPRRPVSINHGYVMPAWYDLHGLDADSSEDEAGISDSRVQIDSLIATEVARGIPTQRIVLAGFSQGGAIALHTGLRHPQALAGIVALSAYLPLKHALAEEADASNARLPIFMAHGTFDDIIQPDISKVSRDALEEWEYSVEWHEYPMAHTVCEDEIADIRRFLVRVLDTGQA